MPIVTVSADKCLTQCLLGKKPADDNNAPLAATDQRTGKHDCNYWREGAAVTITTIDPAFRTKISAEKESPSGGVFYCFLLPREWHSCNEKTYESKMILTVRRGLLRGTPVISTKVC